MFVFFWLVSRRPTKMGWLLASLPLALFALFGNLCADSHPCCRSLLSSLLCNSILGKAPRLLKHISKAGWGGGLDGAEGLLTLRGALNPQGFQQIRGTASLDMALGALKLCPGLRLIWIGTVGFLNWLSLISGSLPKILRQMLPISFNSNMLQLDSTSKSPDRGSVTKNYECFFQAILIGFEQGWFNVFANKMYSDYVHHLWYFFWPSQVPQWSLINNQHAL